MLRGKVKPGILRFLTVKEKAVNSVLNVFAQCHMTDSTIRRSARIIKIRQFLLFHECSYNVDIPVRLFVIGKNVMIGNQYNFFAIPDFRRPSKFLLKIPIVPGPQIS